MLGMDEVAPPNSKRVLHHATEKSTAKEVASVEERAGATIDHLVGYQDLHPLVD